jgi:DNA polymerase-3 subunit gamma/tau
MRDAQSAFDQVIAFAGTTIAASDVATVLGLVRRDLLIEIADAIAREDPTAVFELAGRAVESGYDLRLVVRELARMTRDLLVLSIDPSRVSDPEIAADAERQPLLDLSRRFSGEDLMRAFDILTKAEYDIRTSMQPRYHLEMALVRWIHLRKLVPLTDLIQQLEGGTRLAAPKPAPAAGGGPPAMAAPIVAPASKASTVRAVEARRVTPPPPPAPPRSNAASGTDEAAPSLKPVDPSELKKTFLAEIRKAKKFFYGTVVAQAQRIDFDGDTVIFAFGPQHRALRAQLEQNRAWLESAATQLAGRKMSVTAADGTAATIAAQPAALPVTGGQPSRLDAVPPGDAPDRRQSLKERALSDTGVQNMLDVFAAEIKDVEEM